MKLSYASLALVTWLVTVNATSEAHHSMGAVFDFSQRVSLTGTLMSVDWRNPHIYLQVDAKNDQGQLESWSFEGPSPVVFRNLDNADRSDFEGAIGMTVRIDASRARDGSMTALIRTIEFPGGKQVTLCPNNC